jgi:hypothetical protein
MLNEIALQIKKDTQKTHLQCGQKTSVVLTIANDTIRIIIKTRVFLSQAIVLP